MSLIIINKIILHVTCNTVVKKSKATAFEITKKFQRLNVSCKFSLFSVDGTLIRTLNQPDDGVKYAVKYFFL